MFYNLFYKKKWEKRQLLFYDFFPKLISIDIFFKSELTFQCIIARQERETDWLKPTNKWTDGYTDAQTVHHYTKGGSDCMQQAVTGNLAP